MAAMLHFEPHPPGALGANSYLHEHPAPQLQEEGPVHPTPHLQPSPPEHLQCLQAWQAHPDPQAQLSPQLQGFPQAAVQLGPFPDMIFKFRFRKSGKM